MEVIIVLSRKRNRQNKSTKRPYSDGRHRRWKVEFADRDPEEGDLLYVASEYARTGLYFPYRTKDTKDWQEHAHGFEGVIEALLEEPESFSIEGFEEYYSRQELEMIKAIQEKLQENRS